MLRITNAGTTSRLLQHLEVAQTRLAETQDRMGSGRRISKPSDDPFGNSRVMAMRTQMGLIGQHQRGIELARSELAVTEASLENLGRVLARAQELAVQADSSTVDANGRAAIAVEVDSLLQEAVTIGNASFGGHRLFAGYQTAAPAFTPDTPANASTVTFNGDNGVVSREIGAGESIQVNFDGQMLFGGIFTSLIDFREALSANDRVALGSANQALTVNADNALRARGEIGARVRRVDLASERLEGSELQLQLDISALEEADLTQEAVDFQMRDAALQAALAATAKSLTTSLIAFLR